MDETYLSFQDIMWRTVHGHAGLCGLKEKYYDNEFLADLKSVCSDVSKAHAIAKPTGLTFLKKDAIPDNELIEVKAKYRKLENYLTRKLKGETNEKDLEKAIDVADSLIKYFKPNL